MGREAAVEVSLLMPVRDAAETLPCCLASIFAQTLQRWELIAVDDHSADASLHILQQAAAADARVRVVHNDGTGIVDALNTGLSRARAPLIARMDADDLMTPARLSLQAAQMGADRALSVLGCRVSVFPQPTEGGARYLRWQNDVCTPAEISNDIFVEAPFAHPAVMMRHAVLDAAGGYASGDFPEDYELWLRLHQRGHKMAKLAQTLFHWRDSPTRLSRTDKRYRRTAFDRLRARYLAQDARLARQRERFVIWGAGRRTRQRCSHLLQRGFTPQAWIDIDRRKIGNRIDSVPVHAPEWLESNRMFVLGYVAAHGARDEMTRWLRRRGYRPGEDYLMVG